ncbi:TPA: hypothetical protein QIS90_001272 [Providencia rettgeri]|nr:hypothetical protein [Providencia rettgeri]
MNEKNSHIITLTVGGTELSFEPTLVAYNKLLNESARAADLVGAVTTYLKRIVTPDSRQALEPFLVKAGAPAKLAEKINEIYSPDLDIEIKE